MATDLEITPLRLGPDDAGRCVSAEEFRTADFEEGFTYELTWQRDDYAERTLTIADEYATPLLPGLSVPMSEVFADSAHRCFRPLF